MSVSRPRSKTPRNDSGSTLDGLPEADARAVARWAEREARLVKPAGALGRLEDLGRWLAAWQGYPLKLRRPKVVVFAGNHGVARLGVSAFPAEVTVQMVAAFKQGGAAINQICRAQGIALRVVPLELARPTADFTRAAAMTEAEFARAFAQGGEAVRNTDLLVLGEMGISNTTAAAAICLALYGGRAVDWVGPGTGVKGAAIERKRRVVAAAIARHRRHLSNPWEIMRRVGGRELAAIAGAVVAARRRRIPVVLDGFVATAAAAALARARPDALDHCVVGHVSAEPGHRRLLAKLGKPPLLDLGMRLGEASGAALAVGLIRAAAACHSGMSTFEGANVSERRSSS